MENRNELDLGLMTTEDMKSVEKVFEEQNDTEMRSASAVAAGAGGDAAAGPQPSVRLLLVHRKRALRAGRAGKRLSGLL